MVRYHELYYRHSSMTDKFKIDCQEFVVYLGIMGGLTKCPSHAITEKVTSLQSQLLAGGAEHRQTTAYFVSALTVGVGSG